MAASKKNDVKEKRNRGDARRAALRWFLPTRKQEASEPPDTARYCDVVMKGGIASGVTYPLAMVELAKAYHFRNIGGTSTGAIAAAFTAAAEHGRGGEQGRGDQEPGGGFARLADLPAWFGQPSGEPGKHNLLALFKPSRETAPLLNIFLNIVRSDWSVLGIFWHTVVGAARSMPVTTGLGLLPGLLIMAMALVDGGGLATAAGLIGGAVVTVLGLSAVILWRLGRIIFEDVPDNYYGVCTGYAPPEAGVCPPLTTWIADRLEDFAGRPADGPPLTFGDLWNGPGGNGHGVNLRVMSTNLTQGRPMSVPFEDPGRKGIGQYYYNPLEMRQLFPPRVVDHLLAHTPESPAGLDLGDLRPLPRAEDLPVVVGVRLSLSYPLLLSAVPLYTVDWTRDMPSEERRPERCWFSDGGITSNFPVHFFDQPLPRWPTFAINLRKPHPDLPDVEVWMPRSNRQRGIALWNRFDRPGETSLAGFIRAIKDVAQNWMDNEQARIPGYRDRVVHITLGRGEGGINLNMPEEKVTRLADRGRRAGALLMERFATGPDWDVASNWDTHRWVRFRSTLQVLEELLVELRASYRHQVPGERDYGELVRRELGQPPTDYPWASEEQRAHAINTVEELVEIVEGWTEVYQTFGKIDEDSPGPPEPYPILRVSPRI